MTADTFFVQNRKEPESLLQAILTSSSDGIALVGVDGRFLEANATFGRMFGLDSQQIIGMKCHEVLSCEDAGKHMCRGELCRVQRALRQEQPLPAIEVDLSLQGTIRSLSLSMVPVTMASTRLCLIVARDMTALRDAARIKTSFISMITHELRSPLNAMHGYLDLALTGVAGELNEQQRDFIRRARMASEHLYALLEDLLLIGRADAGQWQLNCEIVNLQEVITDALEELELTIADNEITLTLDTDDTIPPIYADSVRMQQVVRNLLSNALRFTPTSGQITISTHIEPNTYQDISAEHGRVVVLQVSDTGSGIPLEQQQRIFERYYQVSNPDANRVRGQGLGLAIVKMIVELHGGRVFVRSAPGQGSTFVCVLPCLLS
jgi:two-component system phosphate regulon sensor histidine kinase PhoR